MLLKTAYQGLCPKSDFKQAGHGGVLEPIALSLSTALSGGALKRPYGARPIVRSSLNTRIERPQPIDCRRDVFVTEAVAVRGSIMNQIEAEVIP